MHWWCTDDATIMHGWCMDDARMMHWWYRYEWCLYPWSLTMKHVSLMRDFFVSDGRTNGRTDKPILGVGFERPISIGRLFRKYHNFYTIQGKWLSLYCVRSQHCHSSPGYVQSLVKTCIHCTFSTFIVSFKLFFRLSGVSHFYRNIYCQDLSTFSANFVMAEKQTP